MTKAVRTYHVESSEGANLKTYQAGVALATANRHLKTMAATFGAVPLRTLENLSGKLELSDGESFVRVTVIYDRGIAEPTCAELAEYFVERMDLAELVSYATESFTSHYETDTDSYARDVEQWAELEGVT